MFVAAQVPFTESSDVKESGQRQVEKHMAELGLPWTSFRRVMLDCLDEALCTTLAIWHLSDGMLFVSHLLPSYVLPVPVACIERTPVGSFGRKILDVVQELAVFTVSRNVVLVLFQAAVHLRTPDQQARLPRLVLRPCRAWN